jgi:hypothetical protein
MILGVGGSDFWAMATRELEIQNWAAFELMHRRRRLNYTQTKDIISLHIPFHCDT